MRIDMEMTEELLNKFLIDVYHRMMVHHTLWFDEVEKELGTAKALQTMEVAWDKTRDITFQRVGQMLSIEGDKGDSFFLQLTHDKKEELLNELAKCWLAQDGVWFQEVEFTEGMTCAKKCNDATWKRFSPFEAYSVKRLLGLEEHCGLKGLQKALDFRIYSRLNKQSSYFWGDNLIFEMNDCRVQSARVRKGLADYPCKSAGLVEYSYFAKGIDERIQMECIGCPPDPHPDKWFCAWKFFVV